MKSVKSYSYKANRALRSDEETSSEDEDLDPLRCWDCNVNFTNKFFLHKHLIHHIKQPQIILQRSLPSLKITLKNKTGNNFEIISSPTGEKRLTQPILADNVDRLKEEPEPETEAAAEAEDAALSALQGCDSEEIEEALDGAESAFIDEPSVSFSPNFADINGCSLGEEDEEEPTASEETTSTAPMAAAAVVQPPPLVAFSPHVGEVPGAEPTPPPEPAQPETAPSPASFPKIRIKTTGLLKDPPQQRETLTITEITDDNPDGDPHLVQGQQSGSSNSAPAGSLWTTPSIEDPLKLPDDSDASLMSLFNNNERAKDLGFTTSDSEFISLDRLDERNRNALTLYNSNVATSSANPLETLTGLPMQALAQQVSRLQPSGNSSGLHQQNVLINIQQFPSAPPPHQPYPQPPMYAPHHPPVGHPQQPMPQYQPYPPQYQPPSPYYPQPPGYGHQMPPPQPPMGQLGQPPMSQPPQMPPTQGPPHMSQGVMGGPNNQMVSQQGPPNQQQQQGGHQQPPPYRGPQQQQMGGPRMGGPRPIAPAQRMATPRGQGPGMQPRAQMAARQRAPMMRPRAAVGMQPGGRGSVGVRPRMPNGTAPGGRPMQGQSPIKRGTDGANIGGMQIKKKKFDVLTPDKDDEDCQVICMQPKNTDGGLPQIESVQGGQSEPAESSIMHLSDSITLSVRQPQPKPVQGPESPAKKDAKAVANVLASRGITVTATAKAKEQQPQPTSGSSLPSALNLNGAVSIIPAGNKTNGTAKSTNQEPQLPTVDLTDDTPESKSNSPQKGRTGGLPYRCELCPAQYPSALGLSKHRQTYHKTTTAAPDLGIPVINLKQPGLMMRLASMGIQSYIPVPSSGPEGTFAIPVISSRNPGNVAQLGATSMIQLGPLRSIPKPNQGPTQGAKPGNVNQK